MLLKPDMAYKLTLKGFYTAGELAKYCEVDLKTIHNWIKKGRIESFKTPGGHMRISHANLCGFLGSNGFGVPEQLLAQPETVDSVVQLPELRVDL